MLFSAQSAKAEINLTYVKSLPDWVQQELIQRDAICKTIPYGLLDWVEPDWKTPRINTVNAVMRLGFKSLYPEKWTADYADEITNCQVHIIESISDNKSTLADVTFINEILSITNSEAYQIAKQRWQKNINNILNYLKSPPTGQRYVGMPDTSIDLSGKSSIRYCEKATGRKCFYVPESCYAVLKTEQTYYECSAYTYK